MNVGGDLYQILGLANFSHIVNIKRAYRKLALKNHPDRGGDIEKMKLINMAYEILSKHKDKYDSALKAALTPRVRTTFYYYNFYSSGTGSGTTPDNWTFYNSGSTA